MKKLGIMVLFIFSVSGVAQASIGSIDLETTRLKEMVNRVSEKMSVDEAERILEEKEIISEDFRVYSLEREATTLAAKMVLERSSQSFNIFCPCGQTCDGQLGFFCSWGYSCNGFGVCEKVNPRGGG